MDVIERLTKQGKDLGYEGETLQTFVKEQQIKLPYERKAMREAERERHEAENAKREAEARIEHEKREAEAKLERERRDAEVIIVHEKREAEGKRREAEAKFER